MTAHDESIVCFDYPNCDREHAGGAGGVPVHPPKGSRISGDEPLPWAWDSDPMSPAHALANELFANIERLSRDISRLRMAGLEYGNKLVIIAPLRGVDVPPPRPLPGVTFLGLQVYLGSVLYPMVALAEP